MAPELCSFLQMPCGYIYDGTTYCSDAMEIDVEVFIE